jgi:ATP-dependent Clp protease, protease subunit
MTAQENAPYPPSAPPNHDKITAMRQNLSISHMPLACLYTVSTLALSAPVFAESAPQDLHPSKISTHEYALQRLREEKEQLELDNALQEEKNKRELADLTAQRDKLLLENEIKEAQQKQMTAELTALKEKLELEIAIREAEQRQTMAEMETEKARLDLENSLQEAKNRTEQLKIDLEIAQLGLRSSRQELERSQRNRAMEQLDEQIIARIKLEEWESQADKQDYPEHSFVDGVLTISDRRIYIDGPIVPGIGDYITERINFYNNKNTDHPIFIIIDRCSGGSVVEGAQILKAMESSSAPIYVVVRSLAASMAAVLTALADKSFAYPNAVIIHHQVSGFFFGNLTQQKEQLSMTETWATRLMTPVAERMGLSLNDFFNLMYENNSEGNWLEFADNALKLGWIDHVVSEVRDTSHIKRPSDGNRPEQVQGLLLSAEQHDPQGRRFVQLPHLGPSDFYYLYNPDNYYR